MKYFDTVFKKQNQTIELFAPVILQEVAIIKDTVDDIVQLRNIFYNASTQDIIAVAIRVTQSDVFGEPIATPFEYVYEDILCHPSEIFGNKTAIDLHPKARRVQVDILKAVLQDGTVWVSDPENIVHIQPQHEIEASDEFISGIDDNPISPVFYYVENDSCWQCTCGEPNKSSSLSCHRCNRMRDVVKERFDRAVLTLGFSEYQKQKEREKAREEEERAKQQESTDNPESSKRSRGKTVYLLLAAAAALAVIIFLAVRPTSNDKTSDNTQTQETDSTGSESEGLISHTRDSIKQYVNMIGKQAPKGEEPEVSQDFLDNLDNVFVMGKTGTVVHEYADGMGDTIVMMHWRSNEEASEDDYTEFITLLDEYCGSTGEKGHFDGDVEVESIRWLDPAYDLHLVSWYEENRINLRWQMKDTESDSNSENIESQIETTTESLKPYLDMIGTDTAGTSVNVDDEFLDNMDRVYVMGQTGTVSHATTDGSDNHISLMEWVSNESIEETDFNDYIKLLDQYFNDTAIVSHYDNVTSEDVWAWHITKDNLWPICYRENGKINICWYDRSAVDIPDDSDK